MTPAPATYPLSGWALRRQLGVLGHDASNAQIVEYARWGLLRARRGRYAADSVERALEIIEAETQTRPMYRRVVRLRGDFTRFPVPANALRRALIRLAPTIRTPMRKLRIVERAWAAMSAQIGGLRVGPPRRLPPASRWAVELKAISERTVEVRATSWYAWARDILPVYSGDLRDDFETIPFEERVLMTALLDQTVLSPP